MMWCHQCVCLHTLHWRLSVTQTCWGLVCALSDTERPQQRSRFCLLCLILLFHTLCPALCLALTDQWRHDVSESVKWPTCQQSVASASRRLKLTWFEQNWLTVSNVWCVQHVCVQSQTRWEMVDNYDVAEDLNVENHTVMTSPPPPSSSLCLTTHTHTHTLTDGLLCRCRLSTWLMHYILISIWKLYTFFYHLPPLSSSSSSSQTSH